MTATHRLQAGTLPGVALALLVLNVLLAHGNAWPTIWPALEWRLAAELAPAVMLIAAWGAARGRVPRGLELGLAALGTVWILLHYMDVTVPAVLGRQINLYWDAPHLGAVIRMDGGAGMAGKVMLGVGGAALVTALLYTLVRQCIGALARGAERRSTRLLMLACAGVIAALWLSQNLIARPAARLFAPTVSGMLAEQYRFLNTALSRTASETRLGAGPAFSGSLDGLGGADVLVVFAEAYGAVTFDRPDIARALRAHRERLANAVTTTGRQVVSARLVSPTFGGASWLAHASLLSGLDMRDPTDYQLLLTTDRPTLVRHFAANGYRTVAWLPGIQRPWPEGAFYGFDRYADADRIGYEGRPFGFWRIPDQASIALAHAQELKGAERAPRLIIFPTVTTHAPFRALPPYRPDWAGLLGAEAFSALEVEAAEAVPTSWSNPLPAYVASMRYQFDWLTGYLADHAPENLVMIVIGDHQPIGTVSGPDQPWDVPVHIIARNPALIARLQAVGFVPGVEPPASPLGPTHALTPILIDVFGRTD